MNANWPEFDVLFDFTYVLQLLPDLRLESVSDSIVELTGYTAQEYCADDHLWRTATDSRDRELMLAAFNAPLGKRMTITMRWRVRGDGVIWTQQISRTVQTESGETLLLAGLTRVEAAEDPLPPFAEVAPQPETADMVVQTDLRDRVVWTSESVEAIGWAADRVMGNSFPRLFLDGDQAVVAHVLARVLGGETVTGVIVRTAATDGRMRFISMTMSPTLDEDGAITGACIGWRDLDEVMRARREAENERSLLRATQDAQLDPQIVAEVVLDDAGDMADFRYVDVNLAACRAMGRSREQVIGSDMSVLDPGLGRSGMLKWLAEAIADEEPLVINDFVYTSSKGQVGTYDVRAVPVGGVIAVTWRDVTQRFRSMELLARSEARYRLLFEESSDIVTFHEPDGTVQWVSPAIQRLLGWAPEERTADFLMLLHRDDVAPVIAARDQLLAGAESATTRVRLRCRDRSFRWMESTARAVRDDVGQVRSLVVVTHDIQAQQDAEQALAESEARYRLLAENATDVVYRVSADGMIEWISEGIEKFLGLKPEELVGRPGWDLVAAEDTEAVEHATAEAVAGRTQPVRFRLVAESGRLHWIETTLHPVFDSDDRLEGIVGGWRDVDAEVAAQEALNERVRTDDLTGLLNRREALAQLVVALAAGAHRDQLAVAFCDVDEFKAINDSRGHAVGDRLLQEVATRIKGCVRADDTVARVGGDEILLILRGVRSYDDAMNIAEKVRIAVRSPLAIEGRLVPASVSIGVTMADSEDDVDALVARADRAMYLAKESGRDQVVRLT